MHGLNRFKNGFLILSVLAFFAFFMGLWYIHEEYKSEFPLVFAGTHNDPVMLEYVKCNSIFWYDVPVFEDFLDCNATLKVVNHDASTSYLKNGLLIVKTTYYVPEKRPTDYEAAYSGNNTNIDGNMINYLGIRVPLKSEGIVVDYTWIFPLTDGGGNEFNVTSAPKRLRILSPTAYVTDGRETRGI
jgi:hypothetical protein